MPTTNKKNGGIATAVTSREKTMQVGVLEDFVVKTKRQPKASHIQKIVARCQVGEKSAFRELFDETVAGVHRHLRVLIGPGPDIDDLVQLVFLNVFNSIGKFQGQSAFSTWLFRITVNIARQEIRQRGRRRRLGTAVVEASLVKANWVESTPESRLSVQKEVYEILDQLPMKKRETFILYYYEGYSLEEIASLLNSSVSTIGSRLQSARKEIVKLIANRRKS